MVTTTLKLGISILNGGNSEVQRVSVSPSRPEPLIQFKSPNERSSILPPVLPENAGVPAGQEGRGLFLESPGTDADVQVRCFFCFFLFVFVPIPASSLTLLFLAASWI